MCRGWAVFLAVRLWLRIRIILPCTGVHPFFFILLPSFAVVEATKGAIFQPLREEQFAPGETNTAVIGRVCAHAYCTRRSKQIRLHLRCVAIIAVCVPMQAFFISRLLARSFAAHPSGDQVRKIQASGLLLLGWAARGKGGGHSLPADLVARCFAIVALAEKLHSMDVTIKSHVLWANFNLQLAKGGNAVVACRASSEDGLLDNTLFLTEGGEGTGRAG